MKASDRAVELCALRHRHRGKAHPQSAYHGEQTEEERCMKQYTEMIIFFSGSRCGGLAMRCADRADRYLAWHEWTIYPGKQHPVDSRVV